MQNTANRQAMKPHGTPTESRSILIIGMGMAVVLANTLPADAAEANWPSYNRTLTSERFSSLDEINTKNAAGLKTVCVYDTKQETGFQTGLVQVDGALFATTEQDTFSIDPNTCKENWRTS